MKNPAWTDGVAGKTRWLENRGARFFCSIWSGGRRQAEAQRCSTDREKPGRRRAAADGIMAVE